MTYEDQVLKSNAFCAVKVKTMLTFIDNLNDDNGLLHPGTNAWDLRGSAATVPAHTLMTDREFGHHFDAYDRTPVEIMLSAAESNAPQTSAVPINELLASADQYTDITQAGRYELNLVKISGGKNLPVNALSKTQMQRLVDLIQAGDGMDDATENSETFNAFLDESMNTSVRSEDVAEGDIESVEMTPPSGRPLRMSDLNATPDSNDSSWIGRGASMLGMQRGVQQIRSPNGKWRTIGVV